MRLQILGYDSIKNGEWTIVHAIDLTQYKNTEGFRPFVVNRGGKLTEGLWIPKSKGFVLSPDMKNKQIEVTFGPNGYLQTIELIK